jgi:hypothetical protein
MLVLLCCDNALRLETTMSICKANMGCYLSLQLSPSLEQAHNFMSIIARQDNERVHNECNTNAITDLSTSSPTPAHNSDKN